MFEAIIHSPIVHLATGIAILLVGVALAVVAFIWGVLLFGKAIGEPVTFDRKWPW